MKTKHIQITSVKLKYGTLIRGPVTHEEVDKTGLHKTDI